MTFQKLDILTVELELPANLRGGRDDGEIPTIHHIFEQQHLDALNAALAAGRPLLVRGEPGAGKSQLARAAAKSLGRALWPK